jgi:phosphate uptake regulator
LSTPARERNVSEHTSKQFDAEMEGIRSGVLAMGGLVETQFRRAVEALRLPGDVDVVTLVASDEQAINRMQMDIDQQCSQIIAKRQPAAIDLRMILTVVKIVNELERIGDEIKKIAYKAQQMQRRAPDDCARARHHARRRAGGGKPPARARRLCAARCQRRGDRGQQR